MKYPPNSFCPIPTLLIPFIVVTLLLAYQMSKGQTLTADIVSNAAKEQPKLVTELDQSSMINSSYTTFFVYSLSGQFSNAVIRIVDSHGNLVKEFAVEPASDGAISVPANLLHEGNYRLQIMVDGTIREEHDLHVTR